MKKLLILAWFTSLSLLAGSPPEAVVTVVNEVRVADIIDNPGSFFVISPDGLNAKVVLDASASSDPDNDTLEFAWGEFEEGSLHIFGSGLRVTRDLRTGSYRLGLVVSDGSPFVTEPFVVNVWSPASIVSVLIDVMKDDAMPGKAKQSLVAPLEQALKSFEQGDDRKAVKALRAFLNKTIRKPASPDPVRALGVRELTQILIDTVG